ncbi:MAG: DEAD/DEAH box helicase, partial [Planctomycetaceae bacterium]|nr:DEAD/DEAH box helicase [Planctomycetaceae bacterium]
MEQRSFSALSLHPAILKALTEEGYQHATDIQSRAIPEVLKGRDLLAIAQTGTGKTAAFSLPMLHRLHHQPSGGGRQLRALILTPTRELALQAV